jgi:EmrB/QacA subfamily drug resistance transporter
MNSDNNLGKFGILDYKWLVFGAVALTTIMSTLDSSIVNIALPVIRGEFKVGIVVIEWVVITYLLTITSLLMIFGRMSDLYGRKRIFIIGISIFTIGSALCAIANSVYALVIFRALQGAGAACITAVGMAIVTDVFPPGQRGAVIGWTGTTVAVGMSAGPVVGGIITTHLGWRYIFLINLPLGILAIWLAQRFLQESHISKNPKFDVGGALAFTLGVVTFLLAFTEYENWGVISFIILLVFSLASIMIFLTIERTFSTPMVDLKLFKNANFSYANLSGFLNFAGRFSVVFLFPFYLLELRKMTPAHAGLLMTPIPLLFAFIAPISGSASDKIGTRSLTIAGTLITALGLAMFVFLRDDTSLFYIILSLFLMGLGGGIFSSPNSSTIMGSVPRERLGNAGAMTALMRNMGMIVGVAWSGALFSVLRGGNGIGSNNSPETIIPALQTVMKVSVVIMLLAALASFKRGEILLKEKHSKVRY